MPPNARRPKIDSERRFDDTPDYETVIVQYLAQRAHDRRIEGRRCIEVVSRLGGSKLADTGLVREPDLYGVGLDAFFAPDLRQTLGETFLKSSMAPAACA